MPKELVWICNVAKKSNGLAGPENNWSKWSSVRMLARMHTHWPRAWLFGCIEIETREIWVQVAPKKKELVISKCISFSLHFITAFDTVQYERLHVEFYLSSYRAANLSWFPSRLFQLKGIACRNSFFFPFCSHSTILHALLRFTFRIFRLTSIRYFLNTRKCFARCKGVWRGQTTRQWKSERKKNKTFAIVIVEMKKKTTNRKKKRHLQNTTNGTK